MGLTRRSFLQTSSILATGIAMSKNTVANNIKPTILNAISQQTIRNISSPSLQVVVMKDGKQIENINIGYSNLETQTQATSDTVYRIGSLTKQFTGALILKLHAEKKLSVFDSASSYLPFLGKHDSFTIQELLHHTAGVHEGEYSAKAGEMLQYRIAESISNQEKFFDFPPGSAWLYSNANYKILGAIIERVTNTSLAKATETYITNPLSLNKTRYEDQDQILLGRASGYSHYDSETPTFKNAAWIDVLQAGAAGAMRSNAIDLTKWHQALFFSDYFSETEKSIFLAPATLRNGQLASKNRFNPQDQVMGELQYGFGVNLDRSTKDNSLIVHHNGFIDGFSSYLATHLPSKTTVACLCNIDPNPGLPFRDIRRSVFKDYLLI